MPLTEQKSAGSFIPQETGRDFWHSGLQDTSAAQGTKRMQGTARGR